MQCMKCGRDVEPGEVFCELCLEEMQKYPVRPGTAVVIPHRPERTVPKRPAKRQPTYEEQLVKYRKLNRVLVALLFIYMVIAGVLASLSLSGYSTEAGKYLPGQNYSAIQDDDEPKPPYAIVDGTDDK